MMLKLIAILILGIFYAIYIGKMMLQKRKGITTDQIAKGKVKNKVYYTELVMKIATFSIVAVEIASIVLCDSNIPTWLIAVGIVLGIMGDVIFALAVVTMKDSWRAGLAENDQTKMVNNGIYRFSRNPAFLGFDCVYIGILILFFNPILLLFTLWAIIMLHLQILQEENYLPTVFGDEYKLYKQTVCRYFGRKSDRK